MGQEGKFFQNQRPRRRGRDRRSAVPGMGLFPCSHQELSLSPALGWGWEFSLVSEDGSFGRKGQLATYTELVSWCHRWVCVGGISWSIKNQTCGGEKQSFLLPCSKFLKCTHILLSDVEKPHSGRADKKVVIKELCLYDDIAR